MGPSWFSLLLLSLVHLDRGKRPDGRSAGWAQLGVVSTKLMHSWGFALREGVFAETKEGKCKNKREKS